MEVRIKIGDAVDAIQRGLGALRKRLELIGRQVTVLRLDLSEVVENQTFALPLRLAGDFVTRSL